MESVSPIWSPSNKSVNESQLTAFCHYLQNKYNQTFNHYKELHQWSIDNPESFWSSIADYFNIHFSTQPETVLKPSSSLWKNRWFEGAKLNYAEHLLKQRGSGIALITYAERHPRKAYTYDDLYQQVAQVQAGLLKAGVQPGDRVAAILPNCGEALIAMLATTALGAVWSSCSPDFGIQGVLDRFNQIQPKVLFASNGYLYNGKPMDTVHRIVDIKQQLSTDALLVWVDFFDPEKPFTPPDQVGIEWHDFVDPEASQVTFEPVAFDAPLFILYSSGTTGKPKCIVHSVGGTLLQHVKELGLHTDIKPGDRVFYFTTCGWMMWNWLVSGLAVNATLLLYDGSPVAPNPEVLWRIAETEKLTHFGASAKYYSGLDKLKYHPNNHFKLSSLRCLLSTGSALSAEMFEFLYQNVKTDMCLSSISGGTDIISCFALGNPNLPVYAGELQCKGLGMDVDIVDSEGQSLTQTKGELICRNAFPSMPVGFWDDPNDKKFMAAYFETYPGVWAHGDYGEITQHDGLIIHGRADAVLNPGGVRIGTAEIYRQVETFDEVIEGLAVGQRWKGDERIVLFMVMKPDQELTSELKKKIKSRIRENASPRHVPSKMIQVPDIPRTISGKIVELAVRNAIHGEPITNREALKNPDAIDYFLNIEELNH